MSASSASLTPAEKCTQQFLEALQNGDAGDAERVAFSCLRDDMSVETLYTQVITPAMSRIGDLWEEGKASEADEHLAAELVIRVTASVHGASFRRPNRKRTTILLAGGEEEKHTLGLRMAADVLDLAGHQILYLGAGVPVDAFLAMAGSRRPGLVGLSSTYAVSESEVGSTIARLRDALPDTPVIVGGQLAGETLPARDGIFPAVGLEDLASLVDSLLSEAGDRSSDAADG
jgi:methanogenic corrinoid protein MtbC1